MEFCPECGCQLLHTDNSAICTYCGHFSCECSECIQNERSPYGGKDISYQLSEV
jgi:hypothetical protein